METLGSRPTQKSRSLTNHLLQCSISVSLSPCQSLSVSLYKIYHQIYIIDSMYIGYTISTTGKKSPLSVHQGRDYNERETHRDQSFQLSHIRRPLGTKCLLCLCPAAARKASTAAASAAAQSPRIGQGGPPVLQETHLAGAPLSGGPLSGGPPL